MPRTYCDTRTQELAIKMLIEKHEFYKSWADVSGELGGINRGMLCAIANHKRAAPQSVLIALGIPIPNMALVPVCPVHGIVHVQDCPDYSNH